MFSAYLCRISGGVRKGIEIVKNRGSTLFARTNVEFFYNLEHYKTYYAYGGSKGVFPLARLQKLDFEKV